MKKGFTLTEIMIALAVIAILTVILMPMIFKLRPNQEVLMTKRAYYQTLTIVSEMINNEKCYPPVYDSDGFLDGRKYDTCDISYAATTNPNYKFPAIFKYYLNPVKELSETQATRLRHRYITKDGMQWTVMGQFTAPPGQGYTGGFVLITVDTTGPDVTREHDKFQMRILPNGKVEITGDNAEWARAAVQTDKKFVGND